MYVPIAACPLCFLTYLMFDNIILYATPMPTACTFPPEYCEFGSRFTKCKEWLQEEHPDLFDKYYSDGSYTSSIPPLIKHPIVRHNLSVSMYKHHHFSITIDNTVTHIFSERPPFCFRSPASEVRNTESRGTDKTREGHSEERG